MLSASRSRAATCATALLMALAFILAVPLAAVADINVMDTEYLTSPTNPGKIEDYNTVWRETWGKSPLPQFQIKVPSPNQGQPAIVGGFYTIVRPHDAMITSLNQSMWPKLYNGPVCAGDSWDLSVDVIAEVNCVGPYFGPTGMVPGATRSYEGPFITLFQFFAKDVGGVAQGRFRYGVDMTPPYQVTGLRGVPCYGDAAVSGWLKQSRIHLLWDDKVYDRLSGTGYFETYVDGKPFIKGDTKKSYRVYDLKEHFPGFGTSLATRREMTIEDLPAGKHTVQVRAVDRATNAGALSAPINIAVDPDIPTLSITWPKVSGQTIGAKPTITASVKDLGGVKAVRFYVDGAWKATDTKAPYATTLDLSALKQGSTHKIKVVAWDMVGRTNYAQKSVVVDKVAPSVTLVSAGPTPFYPRKRDGYKDNFVVRFKTTEAATAKLTVRDSSGAVWRTVTKSVAKGSASVSWNGRSNAGTMKQGKFTWTLRLTDVAGNKSAAKKGTATIKYYKTVVSGSSVQVVEL